METKDRMESKKLKLKRRKKGRNSETDKVIPYYPEVMNITEVSLFLHVTPRAVYNLVKAKKIPALKVGTKFRFSKKAVLDALARFPE